MLLGMNVLPIVKYGDIENRISVATAGIFLSKDKTKESMPYSKQFTVDGVLTPYINLHFLAEARRQLAGTEAIGTSTFSPAELVFWIHYTEYCNDVVKDGELLLALVALDEWLVAELTGAVHPVLNRTYIDHKWNKDKVDASQSYIDHPWFKYDKKEVNPKGIQWI